MSLLTKIMDLVNQQDVDRRPATLTEIDAIKDRGMSVDLGTPMVKITDPTDPMELDNKVTHVPFEKPSTHILDDFSL